MTIGSFWRPVLVAVLLGFVAGFGLVVVNL
jgi:hypothetical protein